MKPEKVQAATSSSDASLNLTSKTQNDFSHLYPCSVSNTSHTLKEKKVLNLSKETTTSANKQVISRQNDTSNIDREVIDNGGVSRIDEEQSKSIENKLCFIKCKNKNIEIEVNNESSAENHPLVLTDNKYKSAKSLSLKKNGSTLVFQKKVNSSINDTAKKDSLENWQSNLSENSKKSKGYKWSNSDFYSSEIQNFNSDINVSIRITHKLCFTYLLHLIVNILLKRSRL
jgi:hypothetical protein